MPYWAEVITRDRVWADTHKRHKMGWLNPGDRIHVIEEYGNWRRFDIAGNAPDELFPRDSSYGEWWINAASVGEIEDPVEEDQGTGDETPEHIELAKVGSALRTLIHFIVQEIKSA